MAKKKKTQLKPVARGFATVSVAKKVVPTEPEPEAAPDPVEDPSSSELQGPSSKPDVQRSNDEFDPDKAEEQSLQNLVDKYQDRVEKEVVRTLKAIDQERRFSVTLPKVALDSTYVERVLQLLAESAAQTPPEPGAVDESEDKAIPQLAITYGVLRRLGFEEDIVERCLKSIRGIDLEQAIEWLFIVCSDEELRSIIDRDGASPPSAKHSTLSHRTGSPTPPQSPTRARSRSAFRAISPPTTPGSVAPMQSSQFSDSATLVGSDAVSGRSTPMTQTSASASLPGTPDDGSIAFRGSRFWDSVPSVVTDTLSGSSTPATQTSTAASIPGTPDEDPNSAYVHLKMQISELTTHRKPTETADAKFLRTLQERLEQVRQDYLFDEREAEIAYRAVRKKADEESLQARLRGQNIRSPSPRRRLSPPKKRAPDPPVQITGGDVFDEADEGEGTGGMFELLEEMPKTETTAEGTTITVRDFPAPKNWSGRTPRTLLLEVVHKTDKYANVSFRSISGASRAKRSAVRIIWQQGNVSEWLMEDVACHDSGQAEQYIATVALHRLTFPDTPGFAVGGTASANTQTSFRLLPPVYRDLWDELEDKRRADHDCINRGLWAKLRGILEPKLSGSKTPVKRHRAATQAVRTTPENVSGQDGVSSSQLAADFRTRQESMAYQGMLRQRNTLPIAAYRHEIVSALESSQVLVLSGETGCGKSTQLPAFILEDHLSRGQHCKIYCTEPRRISALSLANRVSQELGEAPGTVGTNGSLVGYSIRLESNTSKTTRLAYVTNGIALRMLEGSTADQRGSSFDEITHIIVDEVHERTIESDFLLIVLKSLIQERPYLKVVLMSATLDAEKFSSYFGGCPILQVPGRTFPVEVRYLEDAVEFTKWKVTEGSPYAMRGYDKYSRNRARNDWSEDTTLANGDEDEITHEDVQLEKRYSSSTASTINMLDERLVPYDLIIMLLEGICLQDSAWSGYSSAVLVFMPGLAEIRRLHEMLMDHPIFQSEEHFKVHPLHSTIASDQQAAVFDVPPPGVKKIVIATNIAETGITIPDITCVIDTGRQKEMRFDEKRQISRLVDTFVAKSNAAQRRGRAGRVQPGLCFHLFTKVRHDTRMADHPDPEIMRLSLSDLALRIKIMKVKMGSSIEDVLSRALDPPSPVNIQRAVSALVEVGALTAAQDITPMGRLLSKLPTDVHLGKFLLIACVFGCLDPALTIAAALNSKSPFLTPFGKEDEAHRQKLSFKIENSDFLTLHNAFSSWRRACVNGPSAARKLCRDAFMSHQNLQQIEELRQQFLGYLLDSQFIRAPPSFIKDLNRARYSSRGRTRFITPPADLDRNSGSFPIVSAALAAGLYPKILSVEGKPGAERLTTITNNQAVAFHPSSVNFGRKPSDFGVNHLCYFTIMQSKKMYAWETGPVEDLSLLLLCGEAEFKLPAGSVFLDRKVRYNIGHKASVALKYLRREMASTLAMHFSSKPVTGSDAIWEETAMAMLGKVKPEDAEKKIEKITLVTNRVL
ncbi:HrpA-like RNA helicase [Phanerochaete sordida]|uniref:RNA helicase n=1 Tax=Phanerochaete sordida TaxID=48140 RepID=A0A9P3L9H8_9APHY|nr:HrpA-like RNA helicase [Phanerochaete sordida]